MGYGKTPHCCGRHCGDVTTAEDAAENLRRWWCLDCDRSWVEPWIEPPDDHPIPPEPTNAPPGSPEKILVMAARVRLGFYPYHPRDNQQPERVPSRQTGNAHHLTRGVHRVANKWRARIWDRLLRRKVDLGLHGTLKDALEAVEAAKQGGGS